MDEQVYKKSEIGAHATTSSVAHLSAFVSKQASETLKNLASAAAMVVQSLLVQAAILEL